MRGRVKVLATPALAAGFRLAGLDVEAVDGPASAASPLDRMAHEPDTAVLLVEQRLLDAVPAARLRDLERRPVPIIVPIPAPTWEGDRRRAEDLVLDILQRAIGYRVRLQ